MRIQDIPWYEWLYAVTDEWQIWAYKTGHRKGGWLIPMKWQYFRVALYNHSHKRKRWLVHKIVGLVYVPNPDNKPFINHKDGDKFNNAYWNIEWCTSSENNTHAYRVLGRTISTANRYRVGEQLRRALSKPVAQYTLEGDLLNTFPSAMEAWRQLWKWQTSISRCCRWECEQMYGYKWKYLI